MIQLIINGQLADVTSDVLSALAITFEGNNIGSLSDRNGNFAKTFDLPLTGNVRSILGLSDQIPSATDTGALLPCEVYYTNWLIFKGSLRVARYFGNKVQVELIGGVGELMAAFQNTTLADVEYSRLATIKCNATDYSNALGNLGAGYVAAGKVDAGAWGKKPQTVSASTLDIYTEQAPLWYKLAPLLQDVADYLGIVLGGTLLTDGKLDDLYLMQGRWGKDRTVASGLVTGDYTDFTLTNGGGSDYVFDNYIVSFDSSTSIYAFAGDDKLSIPNDAGGVMLDVVWKHTIETLEVTGHSLNVQIILLCFYNNILINELKTEQVYSTGTYSNIEIVSKFSFSLATLATMGALGATLGYVQFQVQIAQHNDPTNASVGSVGFSGLFHSIELTPIDRQVSDTIQRPEDKLPAITISDLILDICQRFGYVVNYNSNTKELIFNSLNNLSYRSSAYDWNGKIESPLDSQFGTQYQTEFVFGSYGKTNLYKSADGLDVGILEANITNNDVADAYTSILDLPTVARLNAIDYTKVAGTDTSDVIKQLINHTNYKEGDVVHFCGNWFKAKIDTATGTTAVPGRFVVVQDTINGLSITTDWELIPATSAFDTSTSAYLGRLLADYTNVAFQNEGYQYGYTVGPFIYFTPTGLTWQSAIDNNYQWLSAILNKPRVHKVLLQLRPTDVPIDFSRPVYWNCAYWYIVSVQDYNPLTQESCVAILAQIPDYPTT